MLAAASNQVCVLGPIDTEAETLKYDEDIKIY